MALKYSPAATSRTSEKIGCTVDSLAVKGISPGAMVAILSDPRGPATILVPTRLDAVDGSPVTLVPVVISSAGTVT